MSDLTLWSAGSLACPPTDLFGPGGLELAVNEAGLAWSTGDFTAAASLSPQLVTHVGRDRGARGLLSELADPAGRRRVQAVDGLDGETLHPDPALAAALAAITDKGRAEQAVAAYNQWIAGFVAADPDHFAGVGMIPATDLEAALAALASAQKAGLKGVTLVHPPAGPGTSPGGEATEFWRKAADGGTTICFNAAFGGGAPAIGPHVSAGEAPALSGFFPRFAFSGVPDKVDNLRLLVVNLEAGWLPHALQNADLNYMRAAASRAVHLPDPDALPSEYVRRMLWLTFQQDRFAVLHREFFGEHHLLWSASLPNDDAAWPDGVQQANRICEGIPLEAQRRLLGGNAARLFGLGGAAAFTRQEAEAFRLAVLR
jgi:predicted TIM-barrel fold metal-dependent hydrolase